MNNETSLAEPYVAERLKESSRAARANGSPAAVDHDDLDILRAIVEGTAGSTGEEFFQDLVRHLTSAIGVPYRRHLRVCRREHARPYPRLLGVRKTSRQLRVRPRRYPL